jgi:hypothetical protein
MVSRQKRHATHRSRTATPWRAGSPSRSAAPSSRSERGVPPSGSRPRARSPKSGWSSRQKTPTGLPVARRNATACAAAGKPRTAAAQVQVRLAPRLKSTRHYADAPPRASEPSTIRNRGNARTSGHGVRAPWPNSPGQSVISASGKDVPMTPTHRGMYQPDAADVHALPRNSRKRIRGGRPELGAPAARSEAWVVATSGGAAARKRRRFHHGARRSTAKGVAPRAKVEPKAQSPAHRPALDSRFSL